MLKNAWYRFERWGEQPVSPMHAMLVFMAVALAAFLAGVGLVVFGELNGDHALSFAGVAVVSMAVLVAFFAAMVGSMD